MFTHTVIAQRERNHTILARYIATTTVSCCKPALMCGQQILDNNNNNNIINIYSGWPRKSQRPIVSGLFPLGPLGKQNKSKKPSLVLELSHYPKYSVRNIYNLSD